MFKKHKESTNPEVQEAMQVRDEVMEGLSKVVEDVDRLTNKLIAEYEEAEKGRRWN